MLLQTPGSVYGQEALEKAMEKAKKSMEKALRN
jgi:hypothetical protein